MDIVWIDGKKKMYGSVPPLAMVSAMSGQNNNYPFKTTPGHVWHIAMENGIGVGFMSVKDTAGGLYIDNCYLREDGRVPLGLPECVIVKVTMSRSLVAAVRKHRAASSAGKGFCPYRWKESRQDGVCRKGGKG